jgi:hypothetical protein
VFIEAVAGAGSDALRELRLCEPAHDAIGVMDET